MASSLLAGPLELVNTIAGDIEKVTVESLEGTQLGKVLKKAAEEDIKPPVDEESAIKILKDNIQIAANNHTAKKVWFDTSVVNYTTCEIADIKCPNLLSTYSGTHHTRMDGFNLITGEIQCSVLPKKGNTFHYNEFHTIAATETFTNKACAEKFSAEQNQDTSDTTKKLIDDYNQIAEEFKQQKVKYKEDYIEAGTKTFLDFADWLDALATIDPNKIDIAKTLKTGTTHTTEKYTIVPNDYLLEETKNNFKNLFAYYSGGELSNTAVQAELDKAIRLNSINKTVSNSKFVMYLDYFVKSNALVTDIAFSIFVAFFLWNIFGSWIFQSLTQKMQGGNDGENHLGRGIFGIAAFIMFFSTDVAVKYEITEEGSKNVSQYIEVQTTKAQQLIRILNEYTNEISDKSTDIAIESALNSLNLTSGILEEDNIKAITSEKLILENENVFLHSIYKNKCTKMYEIYKIANALRVIRNGEGQVEQMVNYSDKNDSGMLNMYQINPFPFSENEAVRMIKTKNSSPYFYSDNGGFVKNEYFKDNFNNYLTLTACSQTKKKIIENLERVNEIDNKITMLSDDNTKKGKKEYAKIVHEILWQTRAELGYPAIAFVPATMMMLDKMGTLGDAKKRKALIDKNKAGGEDTMVTSIAKQLPMLALFGGQIPKMIHNLNESMSEIIVKLVSNFIPGGKVATGIKKGVKKLPKKLRKTVKSVTKGISGLIGGDENPGLFDYWLAAEIIENILNTMVYIVLITGSILAFVILFLQKLWTYFASLFLVIHAFASKQYESLPAAAGKIIAISFKTVLLTVSIFLAIYSINLVEVFQELLTSKFANNMGTLVSADFVHKELGDKAVIKLIEFTMAKYVFIGMSHLTFMIVKIVLAVTVIFKLPSYFYDLLEIKVQDIGEQMMDAVQQAQEQQNMKV